MFYGTELCTRQLSSYHMSQQLESKIWRFHQIRINMLCSQKYMSLGLFSWLSNRDGRWWRCIKCQDNGVCKFNATVYNTGCIILHFKVDLQVQSPHEKSWKKLFFIALKVGHSSFPLISGIITQSPAIAFYTRNSRVRRNKWLLLFLWSHCSRVSFHPFEAQQWGRSWKNSEMRLTKAADK